jgi:hypothetical protein
MAELFQHWIEARALTFTNRKHRTRDFSVTAGPDAAFRIDRIAVNLRAKDEVLRPHIYFVLEPMQAPLKAIYESHPTPAIVLKPGKTLKGRMYLMGVELGRKRPRFGLVIRGVKMYAEDRQRRVSGPKNASPEAKKVQIGNQ